MMCASVFFLIFYAYTEAIQINHIKVPNAIKNNSGTPIILDCDYSVRPDDTDLIVKWFLNDEVVYQWIPPQKPQSLGVLKNRVDLNYKSNNDPMSIYRAMKIRNPTSDIAGEYKCFVSTFADEDFSAKNMIVFEPEKALIILEDKPNNGSINFTCYASDVYPAPKLFLYKDQKENYNKKNPLQTLEWNTSKHPNGKYSVFIVANAILKYLDPGTLIHCELKIPGTGYVKKRSLVYYPTETQKGCGQSITHSSTILIILLLVLDLY